MTNSFDFPEGGEGERLHARRRRHFWLILGGLGLLGAAAGLLGGFVAGAAEARQMAPDPLYAWIAAAGLFLFAITFVIGSWRFFATVDELEVADNLWASLIGFYAYAMMFPLWWALEKIGLASEPDHWVIYGVAMAATLVAYGIRKWLLR